MAGPADREPGTPPLRFGVWRQDDHGHRVRIDRGLLEAEARRLVAELESRGHKQTYWIERDPRSH